MTYEVVILRRASNDVIHYHRWAAKHAPITAVLWLDRFESALATLGENPQRCSLAPESRKSPVELRQFLFGRKPNVYRVIFTIAEAQVRVLRVRRAQRRSLTAREIKDSLD